MDLLELNKKFIVLNNIFTNIDVYKNIRHNMTDLAQTFHTIEIMLGKTEEDMMSSFYERYYYRYFNKDHTLKIKTLENKLNDVIQNLKEVNDDKWKKYEKELTE